MKTCTECGEEKPLTDFYLDKGKPRAKCKECQKKKIYALRDADRDTHNAKRKRWKEANPEKYAAHQRKHWEAHREEINERNRRARLEDPDRFRAQGRARWDRNKDSINAVRRLAYDIDSTEILARNREWRAANADQQREARRSYRERNRDEIKRRQKAYYDANPEVFEKHRRRRVARMAGVEHQPYTRREIYERDGGECRDCGKPLPLTKGGFQIDHIVPISLGGPDIPANVQLMCPPCNRRKWATLDGQIHMPV